MGRRIEAEGQSVVGAGLVAGGGINRSLGEGEDVTAVHRVAREGAGVANHGGYQFISGCVSDGRENAHYYSKTFARVCG